MPYVIKTVRGKERLAIVFWIYCVLGIAIVVGSLTYYAESMYHWPKVALYSLAVVELTYIFWAHISLWACAFNTAKPLWGYLARAYVLVAAVAWLWSAFGPKDHTVEIRQISHVQLGTPADGYAAAEFGRWPS